MSQELPRSLDELSQIRDEAGLFSVSLVAYMKENHEDLYEDKKRRGYISDTGGADGTMSTSWFTIMQVREQKRQLELNRAVADALFSSWDEELRNRLAEPEA